MALKHQLKQGLREAYARVLFHTGLHAVVDRIMPRRMTILFGHCVDNPECNGFLPRDMKIRPDSLRRILGWFRGRYELTTIASGYERLGKGEKGPSIVALSVDDGYRDNRTDLLGLLDEFGARATIFLETGAMDGAPINWSHKYHWVIARQPVQQVARRYTELSRDDAARAQIHALLEGSPERLAYHVKRILKYEADLDDRDRTFQQIFVEAGGDEEALRAELYLSWNDVRELHRAGMEMGGHTIHHTILSRLEPNEQAREIEGSKRAIERVLGPGTATTFAYPFGRRWDYDKSAVEATQRAGYQIAVNTHAGTVGRGSQPYELKRLPVDDKSQLHLLVAETCGGFDLLRRIGLDLSE